MTRTSTFSIINDDELWADLDTESAREVLSANTVEGLLKAERLGLAVRTAKRQADAGDFTGVWALWSANRHAEILSVANRTRAELPFDLLRLLQRQADQGNWEGYLQMSWQMNFLPPEELRESAYRHILNQRSRSTGRRLPDSERKVHCWRIKFTLLEMRLQGRWEDMLMYAFVNDFLPTKAEWRAAMDAIGTDRADSWTEKFKNKAQEIGTSKWTSRFFPKKKRKAA